MWPFESGACCSLRNLALMCDYCGCRNSGPTAELAAEHERLLELGVALGRPWRGPGAPDAPGRSALFSEFVRLLEMHAAKEEIGLFVHAKASTPLGDQIDALCHEHDDLRRWLAAGPEGAGVPDALRLLVTQIDDEAFDLFPHFIFALAPDQWDEIELAHRAIEAVWDESDGPEGFASTPRIAASGASHVHPHDHPHPHGHHRETAHEHRTSHEHDA